MDSTASDDTMIVSIRSAMKGTYSIGSSGDYKSFASAILDLNSRGICGPVVFEIADGIYKDQIGLGAIKGSSSTNTITFEGASGDSSKVTLTAASSGSSTYNYVLQLYGAQYTVFRNMTFERTGYNNYGGVLLLQYGASNNTFEHCRFLGVLAKTASKTRALVYYNTSYNSHNIFRNNLFRRADGGIMHDYNTGGSWAYGNIFEHNRLDSLTDYPFNMYYEDTLIIRNNTITDILGKKATAIWCRACDSILTISGNKINLANAGFGISIHYSYLRKDAGNIYNNMISIQGNDTAFGIYLDMCYRLNLFNNSVLIQGQSSVGKALYVYNLYTTLPYRDSIYNNAFVNMSGGPAIDVYDYPDSIIGKCDYNDLYAPNSKVLGKWGSKSAFTMKEWQSITGRDKNSVSANPKYKSVNDLHARSSFLNGNAKPLKLVSTDIDDTSRSTTSPDIGADEFTPGSNDLALWGFSEPANYNCGDTRTRISVMVANPGSSSQSGCTVYAEVRRAGSTKTFSKKYTSSLLGATLDTFLITDSFNSTAGGIYTIKAYVALSNDADRSDDTVSTSFEFGRRPSAPLAKSDSICGSGSVKLSAGTDANSVARWFDSDTAIWPLAQGNTFSTPALPSTKTYYVAQYAVSYDSLGLRDNRTGYSSIYTTMSAGLVFDAYSSFTLDTVFVYPNGAGDVKVNIYNNSGKSIFSNTVTVKDTGRKAIPLNVKIPAGNGYTIDAQGTTTGGLSRNIFGATYPYTIKNTVSIVNTINNSPGYYYFFYDWHISDTGCASPRVPVKAIIRKAPKGVSIKAGSVFSGTFNNGSATQPDKVCTKHKVIYELTPPSAYSNADYGSKWLITAFSFSTAKGAAAADTSTSMPGAMGNARLTFIPKNNYADSVFILVITVKDVALNCDTTITRYVKVYASPAAGFGASDVCQGGSIAFTDSSKTGFSLVTYLYDFGDSTTSTLKNPVHTYANSGAYTVIQYVTNGGGCTDSMVKTIVVYPKPVAGFEPSTGCEGVPLQLRDTTRYENTSDLKYSWYFSDSTKDTVQNPVHTFKRSGTYYVSLKVTSPYGCTDSIRKSIKIYSLPNIGFSAKDVCEGEATRFSLTSVSGSNSYHWYFGDGKDSVALNTAHLYSQAGTYAAKLVVTNANGCKDSIVKNVKVYTQPVASFTQSGSCAGSAVAFANDTSANDSGTVYSWNFGDGITAVSINPVHVYGAKGTYTVKLVAKSPSGCADTMSKLISIYSVPKVAFLASDGCQGDTSVFTNKTSLDSGITASYSWDFGDGSASSLENPEHVFTKTGSYTVRLKVTSSADCSDSTSKTINIYSRPAVTFTKSVKGRTLSLKASDTTLSRYVWAFGDGNIDSSGYSVSHTYTKDSIYKLYLVASNANCCSAMVSDTVRINNVGIEASEPGSFAICIYPNPFRDELHIGYELEKASEVQIAVYDLNGREMKRIYQGRQNAGSYQLDMQNADLPAGIYMLRIIIGDEVMSKPIIRLK